jgi:hypothetical protein
MFAMLSKAARTLPVLEELQVRFRDHLPLYVPLFYPGLAMNPYDGRRKILDQLLHRVHH